MLTPTKKKVIGPAGAADTIYYSRRGVCHLPLGGADRTLRARTHEIEQLERRFGGRSILTLIQEENLSISLLKSAIIVLVAHEFVAKKGKQKEKLTEKLVEGWIDNLEEIDGITFEELMEAVVKTLVGGLPNGQRLLDEMNDADDDEKEDKEVPPDEPSPQP